MIQGVELFVWGTLFSYVEEHNKEFVNNSRWTLLFLVMLPDKQKTRTAQRCYMGFIEKLM